MSSFADQTVVTAGRAVVRSGLERLMDNPDLLGDTPIALMTNYTSMTSDLRRGIDGLLAAGVDVRSMITPEHGFWGAVQAGESEPGGADPVTGLPVFDAYRKEDADLDALLLAATRELGAELVAYDLQDIGIRFYTYVWSLFDLMCSAARTGIRVLVLDRPNPLGGDRVFGPGLEPGYSSFVGRVSIPIQHGLTVGELARFFAATYVPELTGAEVDLEVIPATGWQRSMTSCETGLPWVMPSPNIPTLESAAIYPATCLLEGTVLSEGRGTTRPFEIIGAGWLDGRFPDALRERELPGIAYRELVFRPTFSKWSGEQAQGVQLYVTERSAFDPIRTGVTILHVLTDLYPDQPLWLTRPDAQSGRPPFIDLLWGSDALRCGIDTRDDIDQILINSPRPRIRPAGVMLYT